MRKHYLMFSNLSTTIPRADHAVESSSPSSSLVRPEKKWNFEVVVVFAVVTFTMEGKASYDICAEIACNRSIFRSSGHLACLARKRETLKAHNWDWSRCLESRARVSLQLSANTIEVHWINHICHLIQSDRAKAWFGVTVGTRPHSPPMT